MGAAEHRPSRFNIGDIAYPATTILLILGILHGLWIPAIGEFLVVEDPMHPADAIVPLAGERSRVVYAAELFSRGYASWFVITDMWVATPNPVIGYTQSVRGQAFEGNVPEDRIRIVPGAVSSTYQEAMKLQKTAEYEGWRSLIVVTSPFHTRRARLILRHVFRDTGIGITVRPVPDHWYRAERWWTTPNGLQSTFEEYLKLALYLMGYHQLFDH